MKKPSTATEAVAKTRPCFCGLGVGVRSIIVVGLIALIASAAPAQAVSPKAAEAVAKPVWGWMFGTVKAATKVKPRSPDIALPPTKKASGKTNLDHLREATKPLSEHNMKQNAKCLMQQRRLADGTIIKHCDTPEERKRKQQSR